MSSCIPLRSSSSLFNPCSIDATSVAIAAFMVAKSSSEILPFTRGSMVCLFKACCSDRRVVNCRCSSSARQAHLRRLTVWSSLKGVCLSFIHREGQRVLSWCAFPSLAQTRSIQGNMCKTRVGKKFSDFTLKKIVFGPWGDNLAFGYADISGDQYRQLRLRLEQAARRDRVACDSRHRWPHHRWR